MIFSLDIIIKCNFLLKYLLQLSSCQSIQDFFKCKNGYCVIKEVLCDGNIDCDDESDEDVDMCKVIINSVLI